MRPLRFLLSLATCIIASVLLLSVGPWRASTEEDDLQEQHGGIATYFNWRTPSSLFPPSATISLTDDNSTFFLARPAAFGPVLPSKSLSGQLWVGSGFGDDHLVRGGPGAGGELGCSDIPDWDDGQYRSNIGSKKGAGGAKSGGADDRETVEGMNKRALPRVLDEKDTAVMEEPTEEDGTDDHLHHPFSSPDGLKSNGKPGRQPKKPTHADIQSLQEGAEIAGKVVLLSRGGCGFLEKVMWVQRRGGVALIVGDDVRGGPLVTMYARGDTSNVTIPSLFTSHTTAHLLLSLIPSGGVLDDISAEEAARLGLALGDTTEEGRHKNAAAEKPIFTTTTIPMKATATAKVREHDRNDRRAKAVYTYEEGDDEHVGWFKSMFTNRDAENRHGDSRRPPSSGNIGWVMQEDFEENESEVEAGKLATTSTSSLPAPSKTVDGKLGDGFVIGVQDWRDADLVAEQMERQKASTSSSTSSVAAQSSSASQHSTLKGGSITPGSGEYGKAVHEAVDLTSSSKHDSHDTASTPAESHAKSGGWLGGLFSSNEDHSKTKSPAKKTETEPSRPAPGSPQVQDFHHHRVTDDYSPHHGLWITLTPTSMSTSPFFDTLLVLVVSPLVTLTVVYALLLLRSRIRRRRWRAPKSVVERLPVRTYQTMPSTTTTSNSSAASPISSPVSATTPLLPSSPRAIDTRPRPRSRTGSEAPVQAGSSSMPSDEMAAPSLEQVEEKRAAGLAEWRRRYGGKQRECVVCLEEYVDGVSRVMSLPCGHEFHAECITPWLTTRRRTCPICKGDVVRSLARSGNAASPSTTTTTAAAVAAAVAGAPQHQQQPQQQQQQQQYHDAVQTEEEIQEQAAGTRNDDPAASQPVSREDEAFEDLERGPDRTR